MSDKTLWPIEKLKPWKDNPRDIRSSDLRRLIGQIKELGVYKPLIVTSLGEVLGGNMRLKALREMGVLEVWVSIVDPKTEAEKLKYALSDNDRAGFYKEKDLAELIIEYGKDIDLTQYKVDLSTNYNLAEVLAQVAPYDLIEDIPPPLVEGEAVSKKGELYRLGLHRLLCGDATGIEDFQKLMSGQRAGMVFTDPPYNVDYRGGENKKLRSKILNDSMTSEAFYKFLLDVCTNMVVCTGGVFYICMSSSEMHNLHRAFTDAGGHWQSYIIWAKNQFTLSRADYQNQMEPILYGMDRERAKRVEDATDQTGFESLPILYGWTKHSWFGGRKQGNVWFYQRPSASKEHPTMKPIALVGRALMNSSEPGDIVLDPFGGSGSTLIACEQTDRLCYMMELDPHYCDVIRKRYANLIGNGGDWQKITAPVI